MQVFSYFGSQCWSLPVSVEYYWCHTMCCRGCNLVRHTISTAATSTNMLPNVTMKLRLGSIVNSCRCNLSSPRMPAEFKLSTKIWWDRRRWKEYSIDRQRNENNSKRTLKYCNTKTTTWETKVETKASHERHIDVSDLYYYAGRSSWVWMSSCAIGYQVRSNAGRLSQWFCSIRSQATKHDRWGTTNPIEKERNHLEYPLC